MAERYDVVVVGVGGMGSAALYHLARRGKRVLGIERFDVPHERGSSHGLTRIIRLAYFEHSDYVPLLRRSYELWRELEREAGEQLLYVTGIVEGGGRILDGVLRSCRDHDLVHEVLDGREVARRFPAYALPPDLQVVFQPDGGFVLPERCIVAHVNGALANGAVVRARERVLEWSEAEAGEQLLWITGAVEGGPRIFEGAVRSSIEHALPFEELDGAEVSRRFPAYRLPADLRVVYQPDGGFVLPERCIVAHVAGARARGAVVRTGERVLEWSAGAEGVRVRTERGEVEADALVLTAGAYSQEVARLAPGMVVAQRQVLGWLDPTRPELFAADRFPVFNLALEEGHVYGFPVHGVPGFKLGFYDYEGAKGEPDSISRDAKPGDEVPLRRFAERYFPDGAGPVLDLKTCLFELSPDEHFLIDRHPETELAVVGAGFSGHGFKFSSVVGEILADLALDGETLHDIGFLRLSRFG